MPQETEEEKSEKREQAKLFRMEVLLDNAKCTRFLVSSLETDPTISVENLQQHIEEEGLVAHPEVLEAFIKNLEITRNNVQGTIEKLKKESQDQRVGMAKTLYRWLLPRDKRWTKRDRLVEPRGEVRLGGVFPFAAIIDIENEKDFLDIDERRIALGTLGLFKPVISTETIGGLLDQLSGNHLDFPLIAVHRQKIEGETFKVIAHERGHAENSVFINALKDADRKFVWGNLEKDDFDPHKLMDLWEKDPEAAKHSILWKRAQEFALAHAKDELLADMAAGNSKILSSTSYRMQYGHGYLYFKSMGIPEESKLHAELRKEFRLTLRLTAEMVGDIAHTYGAFGLSERINLLRWVLAQTPLADWTKQLNETLFKEEHDRITKILKYCFNPGIPEEEKKRREDLYKDLYKDLRSMQDKPLIHVLRNYENELGITNRLKGYASI